MEPLQQFTVAARKTAPIDSTLEVTKRALESVPHARVVSVDRHTGIVVIELPGSEVERVRHELGSDFMFDPNAGLRY